MAQTLESPTAPQSSGDVYIEGKTFLSTDKTSGVLFDLSKAKHPSIVHGWDSGNPLSIHNETSTFFGFIFGGPAVLTFGKMSLVLEEGVYFSCPKTCVISGGEGIAIERFDCQALFSVGGPVEDWGRLQYIDGCTDTCLIQPVKMGEPCLNALYFPQGINQTQHTHPSLRAGLIYNGHGTCILPEGEVPLEPGMRFVIVEDGLHSFRTDDGAMTVIAYHPDSDFGPTDEFHPMLNRTMIDGVSASDLRKRQQVEV